MIYQIILMMSLLDVSLKKSFIAENLIATVLYIQRLRFLISLVGNKYINICEDILRKISMCKKKWSTVMSIARALDLRSGIRFSKLILTLLVIQCLKHLKEHKGYIDNFSVENIWINSVIYTCQSYIMNTFLLMISIIILDGVKNIRYCRQ